MVRYNLIAVFGQRRNMNINIFFENLMDFISLEFRRIFLGLSSIFTVQCTLLITIYIAYFCAQMKLTPSNLLC